jgi:transcription elongation GreA/GreB family factor
MMNKADIKSAVLEQLQRATADLKQQMQVLIEDAANESKSSAGDKHETARAHMHLEQEKLGQSLRILEQQLSIATQLDEAKHDRISPGSLIQTDSGYFYLSVANVIVLHQGHQVRCISAVSPLGKALLGIEVGMKIVVNQRALTILNVL